VRASELLDKPELSIPAIAKKHGVSVDYVKQQLAKGITVEMEHTSHRSVARQIALDHLAEKADYYIELAKVEVNEISDELRRSYLDRANQHVDRRMDHMARVRDRLNKGYEIYHADRPAGSSQIVDRFEADTPELARRYYEKFVQDYVSDVDFDLRLRRSTGIIEDIPAGARAPLYHTSPLANAIKIVDGGAIKPIKPHDSADPKDPRTSQPSISLTRDARLNYYRGGADRITFVIDQAALGQITKIYPHSYSNIKRQESEERVYKPIPLSMVTAIVVPKLLVSHMEETIQILKDRGDWINDEVWNDDSYGNPGWYLSHIMRTAKKQGIKIIVK
jgi:hypothetical protein